MIFSRWLGAFFLVVMFAGSAFADTKSVLEFEGRYWMPDLSAKGSAVKDGVGTELDFVDEVGIDNENFPEARLTWNIGDHGKLRVAYMSMDFSGHETLEREIIFNGETYNIGHDVFADLELKYLRVGWFWQFMATSDNMLKFGPVLEGKIFWADAVLSDPTARIGATETITFGLPTVGFALDFNPTDMFSLFAEMTGIYAGDYGHFFDAEFGGKMLFELSMCNVGLELGYRTFAVNVDYEDDYFDMDLSGVFVGVSVGF